MTFNAQTIDTIDMHTGGEPVRIIRDLYDHIQGKDILEKRRFMHTHLDWVRKFLMFEPRGHYDMYGAALVKPSIPGADLAVLFIHNEGYSTMCGHAVIALARYAVDYGIVAGVSPVTRVQIECPCGLVEAFVEFENGKTGQTYFNSVPAFAYALDQTVDVPGIGQVPFDIGYGGAFYAITPAAALGVSMTDKVSVLVEAATKLSDAVKANFRIRHPEAEDLGFLYGSILTDGKQTGAEGTSQNICVFADAEVDRSPTGSGVTALMALRFAKRQVALDEACVFESITGSQFIANVKQSVDFPEFPAVTVQVKGRAFFTGTATWSLEEGDEQGKGFLLR